MIRLRKQLSRARDSVLLCWGTVHGLLSATSASSAPTPSGSLLCSLVLCKIKVGKVTEDVSESHRRDFREEQDNSIILSVSVVKHS